jgi:uncharacterized phage protein (TIGR01671 family)
MIYPDSDLIKTHHEGSFPPDGMEVEITLEGDAYINYQYAYDSPSFLDNELILLQFTGLTDKNGVEIYEGDILNFEVFDGLVNASGTLKVYFDEGCFRANRFHPIADYLRNGTVEVIGNIYEEASE